MSLNVLVLSSAGKPIFSRYDDGSSVTTAGLVQAMSSFAEDSGSPIRRIVTSAGNEATFMKRGALYLLAIYTNPSGPANSSRQESVASSPIYIECILEYVYSQIVFTLTSKVQAIFRKSGGYDLRGMLGDNHDVILKGLLDKGETTGNFMTASFTPLPLPPLQRNQCTHVLQSLGDHVPNTLFSVLMSKQNAEMKVVTLVQPSNVAHQIDGPDLALLTNFVTQQSTTLRSSESWFPVCLPRFNPTGFIYCYTCCLHDPTELFIMLLSTENSPEQFHMFQNARAAVVSALGLKGRTAGKIIHQHSFEDSRESSMNPNGNQPERASPTMQLQGVGGGGEAAGAEEEGAEEEGEQSAYPVPASVGFAPAENSDPAFRLPRRSSAIEASARGTSDAVAMSAEEEENNVKRSVPLIECILSSSSNQQRSLVDKYSSTASALHFLYRTDADVGSTTGICTQILSPSMQFPFVDERSKARVWGMYQKLAILMREQGAVGDRSFCVGGGIPDQVDHVTPGGAGGAVAEGEWAPAQDFFKRPARDGAVAWIDDKGELFVGVAGKGWEIYAVLPSIIEGGDGVEKVKRLRRKIELDRESLFVTNPGVYA